MDSDSFEVKAGFLVPHSAPLEKTCGLGLERALLSCRKKNSILISILYNSPRHITAQSPPPAQRLS